MASNLRVDNIQPSTGMGIGIGTANGSIYFNSDINGGMNIATGSVGVGTDNPNAAKLDVRGSDNPLLKLTQTTSGIARLNIESETNDGYQYAGIGIGSATADAELMWTTLGFDVNVADSVRLRIPSSGDVQVLTGNLVIGTSGKGIDFSATSDASGKTSELLDDYEEGGWTPTLGNTGTITAGTAEGIYTKIGNICIARVRIDNATFGGSPNDEIRGLPFTAQQRSTTTQVVHANAFTAETITGLVIQSQTYISMGRNPTSGSGFWSGATIQTGTTSPIATGSIPGGVSFAIGAGTYRTA